jgi:hypothetical protein
MSEYYPSVEEYVRVEDFPEVFNFLKQDKDGY